MDGLKPSQYIANFDSEAAMLRALGGYLRNHDFPMTGSMPPSIEPLMKPLVGAVNALPRRVREAVYTWSGRSEAIPPRKLKEVRAEEVSRWVARYLERYRSHRRRWDPPEPDGERPEAEWGFEPLLREDVERFAHERGYQLRHIIFEMPEHLSPLVADLYRWWYEECGLPTNRLLVESFILMEPWWALRTGSVPFWMVFNMEPSAEVLERYLDSTDSYDHIHLKSFLMYIYPDRR